MSYKFHFRLITLSCLVLLSWNSMAADESSKPASEPASPAIPASQQMDLKAAGDAFMRQFSASESLSEYRSAFEGLLARHATDKASASSKALELAANVSVGQVALKDEIGKPIKGAYVYVGSRRIGARVLKLAYLRKHTLGPLPLVLVFNKMDQEWTIAQIAIGAGTAGPDVNALWVYETSPVVKQTITDFANLRTATDECLKALVQGETRPSIERLVKRFSQNAPNPSLLIDAVVKAVEGRPDAGKSLGYELFGTARESDSRCKLIYNWRFEKVHGALCFEFYKAADSWLLWQVRLFDDATQDLTANTVSEPAK
jgi:hypothetical protein